MHALLALPWGFWPPAGPFQQCLSLWSLSFGPFLQAWAGAEASLGPKFSVSHGAWHTARPSEGLLNK